MGRNFTWLATGGGAWSLASNWNDVTDGIDPSLVVPGPQDNVGVTGPTGTGIQTITGQGDVLAAAFAGNTALTGSFVAASLTSGAGGGGGLLEIDQGSLDAGTLDVASGDLLASGTSTALSVSGALTIGAGQSGLGAAACGLDATAGATVQAASLALDASAAALYVDAASSLEVGTVGGAAPGLLTIDTGATLSGQGNANAYGADLNDGSIIATGGDLLVGTLTGTGVLDIGGGAVLTLNGRTGAGQHVLFAGAQGTLAIATEFDQPQGTISLFAAGDAIDMLGSPISAATYRATGSNIGVLTLWYGSQAADTLTLAGNYAGDAFLTAGDGGLGTLITVAPQTSGGGGGPDPGTAAPDVYQWVAAGGGNWKHAANWTDITAGQNPAHVAPGANNLVTIDSPTAGSFAVIAGPANAATLTLGGDIALAGIFNIGTLAIGQNATAQPGALDLLPGSTLAATAAVIGDGALSVAGGAVLAVAGTLVMGGGASGVGLPATALSATAGGTFTAAALTLGGGSGDSITTDPTGVIEIGTAGGAAAGAVTVDAGATLAGSGSVNPFGAIVDNGTIAALGGTLTLGAALGSGVLSIGAGAGLALNAGTAMGITFGGAGSELLLADELVAVTGTLTGFVQGDAIDIENDPITAATTGVAGGNTVLSLYYGSTLVNRLILAGVLGGHFVLTPDGAGGTAIVLSGNSGGGGGGGQGNTDLLAWADPGTGGPWSAASNWYDVTTGSAALAPPGAQNTVQITGPDGISFQSIGGPGLCASLQFWGNSLLVHAFDAPTLTVGGTSGGTLSAGTVEVGASSGLTATAQASILDGTLLVGTGGLLSIGATLSVGDGTPGDSAAYSLLSVSGSGTAQLAGLALGGGGDAAVQTGATGVIEIGTAGNAAAGAVTIDSGVAAGGNGDINLGGLVVVDGTLTASGGTLVVGAVSGFGTLSIGAEATLALTAVDECAIDFASAGGATLLLPGTAETPAAPLFGFGPGDAIVTGSSQVSAVHYTPGAGDIGTLTMYDGSAIAGTLLLAGDFAGDSFSLAPDGDGSDISVQGQNNTAPSAGTPTPDDYEWIGAAGTGWNSAANWRDVTAGQDPAAIAPGAHDLVTVQGATGSAYTDIIGPADASSLALYGNVALVGAYTIGVLAVGGASQAGALAVSAGSCIDAGFTTIFGGVALQGGALDTGATLSLAGGALIAAGGAAVQAAGLTMSGPAVLTVDALSAVEIGTAGGAARGAVTVDAGATLAGAGAADPTGAVIDEGTITAGGGTLTLGGVAGTGTLLVGVGATLALEGAAAAGLLIDFAGPGTLDARNATPSADIANFGDGDEIILPVTGITDTEYAQTAPGLGVLTLLAGRSVLATLNLVGVGLGQSFAATAAAGGTVITTQTTDWGGGGGTVRNPGTESSSGTFGVVQDFAFWQDLPQPAQDVLAAMQAAHGNEAWIDTSTDGSSWDNPAPATANFAVLSDPDPRTIVGLPAGYTALLAQGLNPVWLADAGAGNALLLGNDGNDTISGTGANDTMVGGSGNTLFFANYAADIYGGGNDTIITGQGDARITTAAGARSVVYLGATSSNLVSQGDDLVLCAPGAGSNDTIWAVQQDTIFAASVGRTTVVTGNGPSAIIGNPGQLAIDGGAGNGSVVFAGAASFTQYNGGGGAAVIVGGSGYLQLRGGTGAVTVFGGAGPAVIAGAAGPSFYLVGNGASTVTAASGNGVWLVGAANDSLIASGGNILLWGANSAGNDVFQAGSGACTASGGSGGDTFLGGAGAATLVGGSGADVFSFTSGLAGGADLIENFNIVSDSIVLYGYAGYTSSVADGSEVITLKDGTSIELNGIASLAGVNIVLS
jgi:hypothetical protein